MQCQPHASYRKGGLEVGLHTVPVAGIPAQAGFSTAELDNHFALLTGTHKQMHSRLRGNDDPFFFFFDQVLVYRIPAED
jgi:hypothetical protein